MKRRTSNVRLFLNVKKNKCLLENLLFRFVLLRVHHENFLELALSIVRECLEYKKNDRDHCDVR